MLIHVVFGAVVVVSIGLMSGMISHHSARPRAWNQPLTHRIEGSK